MRALIGLLFILFVGTAADAEGERTARRKRASPFGAGLAEISPQGRREDAEDLPEDVRQAIERWTSPL